MIAASRSVCAPIFAISSLFNRLDLARTKSIMPLVDAVATATSCEIVATARGPQSSAAPQSSMFAGGVSGCKSNLGSMSGASWRHNYILYTPYGGDGRLFSAPSPVIKLPL